MKSEELAGEDGRRDSDPNREAELSRETDLQIARYSRRASKYDIEVFIMDLILGKDIRRRLFDGKYETLLEVGVGTGSNIEFYPPESESHAIDLTPAMLDQAVARSKKMGRVVDFRRMDVTRMEYPDNCFDRIVASCLFCSVPDPVAGLGELRRVIKPGGEIHMLEHMRPDLPIIGRLFDKIDGFFYQRAGFHIARRTLDNINAAGLKIKTDETMLARIFHYLVVVKEG